MAIILVCSQGVLGWTKLIILIWINLYKVYPTLSPQTNSLQEGSKTLPAVSWRAFPKGLQNAVEWLDTIGSCRLSQRRNGQSCNGSHLLLFICKPFCDDLNNTLEMRQDGTTHENSNLLNDLDACVAGLPRLLTQAYGLEERQQGRDAQRRRDNRKGTGSCVTHVLVYGNEKSLFTTA